MIRDEEGAGVEETEGLRGVENDQSVWCVGASTPK